MDKKEQIRILEEKLNKGDISIVEWATTKIDGSIERMKEKHPEMLWSMEIQKFMWDNYRDCKKKGKKLVFYGGSVPTELIAAFDCFGFYMDVIPFRLASNPSVTARFIDEAEKYVGSSMCGLDKTELGCELLNATGLEPDIFVYNSVPCDSSRVAYPAMEKILNVPTFSFDTPYRRDERGAEYLADQMEDFISFMEEHTGNKLDWEKLKYYMNQANENFELQKQCADLRKLKPCPMPGRLLVLNGTTNAVACYPEMADCLRGELEMGNMVHEMGMGACRNGEKYRIAMLQNMIWGNPGIMDWLEREYDACAIMDAFGFQGDFHYDHLDDRRDCLKIMGKKMQNNPMIHGASGPSQFHLQMVDEIFENYDCNVSMFLGHTGCKHTWASSKMLSDMIQEKYGLPTLFVDLDCIDGRYKSESEVKAQIAEYMETVVMK